MSYRIAIVGGGIHQALRASAHRHGWTVVDLAELPPPSDLAVDAVVVDTHHPEADAVLERVQKARPDITRFLVRSTAAPATVSQRLAHAVVGENQHGPDLDRVLDNVRTVVSAIDNKTVRDLAGEITELPPLPSTYWAIRDAAARTSTSTSEIATIIENDPAIALRVLQHANSVAFGATRRVTSIAQAVAMLGVEGIATLVASANAFTAFDVGMRELSLDHFRMFSLTVAKLARQFVPEHGEEAFAAGLFHDLGKLVLAARRPREMIQALVEEGDGAPVFQRERALTGCGHPEVGAYVLERWALPLSLVQVVAYHHTPSEAPDPTPVLAAVHAADLLLGKARCGDQEEVDLGFLEKVGLRGELPRWEMLVAEVR